MKHLVWTFLMFVTFTNAFASDYELIRFEASDYVDFTIEDLKGFLGENWKMINSLQCNGINENDPFFPPQRTQGARNSLKIIDPETKQVFTYNKSKLFHENGKRYRGMQHPFVEQTFNLLTKLEKIPATQKLLRHLEESYFPIFIKKSYYSFNPSKEEIRMRTGLIMAEAAAFISTLRWHKGMEFSDVGVGGYVSWDTEHKIEAIEEDGVKREGIPYIGLAHELYHAFDSIRGYLDSAFVGGENVEFAQVQEYRAIYFENLVRVQSGLKRRKFLTTRIDPKDYFTASDLLDESGNSIYIPAPCLKTLP